jgi:soluble lytic murein transglycosylase-like protein
MNIMTLILALIAVESSGNDQAIGDGGLAYGPLQIHASYVADASEFAKKDWKHEDAFDRETAIDMFLAYMSRYATEKRIGRPVTIMDMARIHNGGPNGYKKKATLVYWEKVKKELFSREALASHNLNQ